MLQKLILDYFDFESRAVGRDDSLPSRRMFPSFFAPLIVGMIVTVGQPVAALTITAIDSGFVTAAGGSAKGDGTVSSATYNYSVGREVHYVDGVLFSPTTAMDRKNYFVFDLTSVTTPIASVSLELYAGTYESVDASETFDLVAPLDMGAAIADTSFLLAENGVGPTAFDSPMDPAIGVAMALYGNLAGGPPTPLGSTSVSAADDATILSIALDPAGVGFLNSFLGGIVVIGGSVPTAVGTGTPQQPFGFTAPDIPGGDPLTPSLVLTLVPEPGTATLIALGLMALAGGGRRKRDRSQ